MKIKIVTILLLIVLIGSLFTNHLLADTYTNELAKQNNGSENTMKSIPQNAHLLDNTQSIQKTIHLANNKTLMKKASSDLSLEKTKKMIKQNQKKEDKKISISIGEKDKEALLKIVEAEATGEDIMGRILVANVIFNRVKSDQFPSTVYDVIHQKINGRAQFSPIDDGRYDTITVSKKTIEAVNLAVKGADYSEGALFFVAPSMASKKSLEWFQRKLVKVLKHGVHEFYKY